MHVKSFTLAAMLVALSGLSQLALAQYGPPGSPYGYPGMGGYGVMPASAYGAAPACDSPTCTSPTCSSACPTGCGDCGCCDECCGGFCHRLSFFGDFLYLRARNAEVAYAVPVDGAITAPGLPPVPVQVGPVQTINPDFQPGFRVGGTYVLDQCSLIQATYSQLDCDSTNSIQLNGGLDPVLRPLTTSPGPLNAGSDVLDAAAQQFIQFKLVDVDYKGLFAYCSDYRAAYIIGARYAQLDQEFTAQYRVNEDQDVLSQVGFHGGGIRLGLEAERYGHHNQFFGYARGVASFVGGEFSTRYRYSDETADPVTTTSWRAGRLVTIADLEVGLGWQNHCGNIRLSAGYMYSMWFNVVKTNEWIHTVQQNNFTDPSDNYAGFMSFDGLTTRFEFLW
ncbi:MAG: Lpg1974 family pore-forming outer membrane protein [Pirellulaceae bacterium]|nr:Lpg1974 family pore-forming outer membrane protein [Pirellulaceae bacterium]